MDKFVHPSVQSWQSCLPLQTEWDASLFIPITSGSETSCTVSLVPIVAGMFVNVHALQVYSELISLSSFYCNDSPAASRKLREERQAS